MQIFVHLTNIRCRCAILFYFRVLFSIVNGTKNIIFAHIWELHAMVGRQRSEKKEFEGLKIAFDSVKNRRG